MHVPRTFSTDAYAFSTRISMVTQPGCLFCFPWWKGVSEQLKNVFPTIPTKDQQKRVLESLLLWEKHFPIALSGCVVLSWAVCMHTVCKKLFSWNVNINWTSCPTQQTHIGQFLSFPAHMFLSVRDLLLCQSKMNMTCAKRKTGKSQHLKITKSRLKANHFIEQW